MTTKTTKSFFDFSNTCFLDQRPSQAASCYSWSLFSQVFSRSWDKVLWHLYKDTEDRIDGWSCRKLGLLHLCFLDISWCGHTKVTTLVLHSEQNGLKVRLYILWLFWGILPSESVPDCDVNKKQSLPIQNFSETHTISRNAESQKSSLLIYHKVKICLDGFFVFDSRVLLLHNK